MIVSKGQRSDRTKLDILNYKKIKKFSLITAISQRIPYLRASSQKYGLFILRKNRPISKGLIIIWND